MGFWDTDYDTMVWLYLPVRRRLPKWWAWLKALGSQAKYIYQQFTTYRNNNLYFLSHNGQVCFLTAVLNDTFDPISRGIYISHPATLARTYEYQASEEEPLYEYQASETTPWYEYQASEYLTSAGGVNFIVHVPVAVTFDTNRMKALINSYKKPTKTYSIVTF